MTILEAILLVQFVTMLLVCLVIDKLRQMRCRLDHLEEYVVNARADVEEVHESVGLLIRGIHRIGGPKE